MTSGTCKAHTPKRESPSRRGYGYRWRKVRRDYLRRHPICEMRIKCEGALATQVHHIDHDNTNNMDTNLQACCLICHATESGWYSQRGDDDAQG